MRDLVFHFLSGVEWNVENEAHRNFGLAEIEVVIEMKILQETVYIIFVQFILINLHDFVHLRLSKYFN